MKKFLISFIVCLFLDSCYNNSLDACGVIVERLPMNTTIPCKRNAIYNYPVKIYSGGHAFYLVYTTKDYL